MPAFKQLQTSAPDGFERIDIDSGFAEMFGPIHIASDRRPVIGFRVAEHHLNELGICHGGVLATLGDMQIYALRSGGLVQGQATPTVSLSIDYMAPCELGAWVEAHATLTKATNRLLFIDSTIFADGVIVGRSKGIYMTPRPTPNAAGASDGFGN